MKRMTFAKQISTAVVFGALAVSSVHAQSTTETVTDTAKEAVDTAKDAVGALTDGWSGSAILGANSISGNTEASNVNAGIRLGKTVGKWEHFVFGSYFKGDATVTVDKLDAAGQPVDETLPNGDVVRAKEVIKSGNSDRLAVGYQPKYYWRPRTYFFGIIDYEQDKPANIKLGARQLIGIGHKFFSNESGFLSGEAGFGNKNTEVVAGEDANGGIAYLGANYLNKINNNVTFDANLRADLGGDNTYTEIGLGLAFKLSERMAVKIAHQTRGNSDITNPALPDASKSDNSTSINLVVDL